MSNSSDSSISDNDLEDELSDIRLLSAVLNSEERRERREVKVTTETPLKSAENCDASSSALNPVPSTSSSVLDKSNCMASPITEPPASSKTTPKDEKNKNASSSSPTEVINIIHKVYTKFGTRTESTESLSESTVRVITEAIDAIERDLNAAASLLEHCGISKLFITKGNAPPDTKKKSAKKSKKRTDGLYRINAALELNCELEIKLIKLRNEVIKRFHECRLKLRRVRVELKLLYHSLQQEKDKEDQDAAQSEAEAQDETQDEAKVETQDEAQVETQAGAEAEAMDDNLLDDEQSVKNNTSEPDNLLEATDDDRSSAEEEQKEPVTPDDESTTDDQSSSLHGSEDTAKGNEPSHNSPEEEWTYKDKCKLKKVLRDMSRDIKRKEFNNRKAHLCRPGIPITKRVKKEIKMIDKQIKSLRKKTLNEIALRIDQEYDWIEVAKKMNSNRTAGEYRDLWKLYLHPDLNKSSWNLDEHISLQEIAKRYNYRDWNRIATELNTGRTAYQCFTYFRKNIYKCSIQRLDKHE